MPDRKYTDKERRQIKLALDTLKGFELLKIIGAGKLGGSIKALERNCIKGKRKELVKQKRKRPVGRPPLSDKEKEKRRLWTEIIDRACWSYNILNYKRLSRIKREFSDLVFVLHRKIIYSNIVYKMKLQQTKKDFENIQRLKIAA